MQAILLESLKKMSLKQQLKTIACIAACLLLPVMVAHASGSLEQSLIEKAQAGTARDRMRLGLRYAMGDGVKADDITAQKWFQQSAEEGYAPAQVGLASMKAFESDVQDIPTAIAWLRKAAQQDNVQAQTELARLLQSGTEGGNNPEEAETWQKKAEELTQQQQLDWAWKLAASGCEKWQIPSDTSPDVVKRQARNVDSPQHTNLTLNIAKIGHAVEAGDNMAKTVGAMLLATGNGIKADQKLAGEWLRDAAKSGYAPAQAVIGQLYRIGWGPFEKNDQAAAEWMKLAAEQGIEEAQIQYAKMLSSGHGTAVDKTKAEALLENACSKNNAQALMVLGFEKLSQDKRAESIELLSRAADYGDEHVLSVLSVLYGWGTAPVGNESAKMTEVRRYAQREDADAQLMLGLFYAEGWGTPRNIEEATVWYNIAINHGNKDAFLPLVLLQVEARQVKEADRSLAGTVKQKAFGFLHEKEMLKMMFEETVPSSEIPEMRDISADEAALAYRAWRREKITRQLHYLSQQAQSGNPVAGYLYGMLVAEGLDISVDKTSGNHLMQASLAKLCSLSTKGLEKECQAQPEGHQ